MNGTFRQRRHGPGEGTEMKLVAKFFDELSTAELYEGVRVKVG